MQAGAHGHSKDTRTWHTHMAHGTWHTHMADARKTVSFAVARSSRQSATPPPPPPHTHPSAYPLISMPSISLQVPNRHKKGREGGGGALQTLAHKPATRKHTGSLLTLAPRPVNAHWGSPRCFHLHTPHPIDHADPVTSHSPTGPVLARRSQCRCRGPGAPARHCFYRSSPRVVAWSEAPPTPTPTPTPTPHATGQNWHWRRQQRHQGLGVRAPAQHQTDA